VAASCWLAAQNWLGMLIAIGLIGNFQRGLGNLYHDFSHGGFKAKRLADELASLLIGLPMLIGMKQYRKDHMSHHAYLGEPGKDPDFIHAPEILQQGTLKAYIRYISTPKIWLGSLTGHLLSGSPQTRVSIFLWWLMVLSVIASLLGVSAAGLFAFLWFAARATSFHLITTYREMTDHVGLEPGGLSSFSRNCPNNDPWRLVFHPFRNGYHLVHHLMPRTPYYKLHRTHELLMRNPVYAQAEHCQRYFNYSANPEAGLSVSNSLSKRYTLS